MNAILCNEVLRTALTTLRGLPPLSLSKGSKIPDVGVNTLNQVTDFLANCSKVSETNDAEGKLS